MKKDKKSKEAKYFIVERSQLGAYGSENGSTKEEARDMLNESSRSDDLVVIKGVLIEPTFVL